MKARHYAGLIILLVLALGTGYLLVPGPSELALMNYRDKKFEAARQLYMEQLAAGNLSVSVVMPLAELHLQNSDAKSAIAVMESFVRLHPGNIEARRRLGTYYQYAGRSREYVANLEEIVRRQNSEEDVLELSHTYNFAGEYARQIEVLHKLIALRPQKAQYYLDLAYLQASQNLLTEAAEALQRMEARCPAGVAAETVEFLLSLLLDTGRAQQAFGAADKWISLHPNQVSLLRYASLLNFKGQPSLALQLLERRPEQAENHPGLTALLVELEVGSGKGDRAFQRLRSLFEKSEALPEELLAPLVELALARDDRPLAGRIVLANPIDGLPAWLVVGLADAMIAGEDRVLCRQLLEKLQGSSAAGRHPVTAARLAFAAQDAGAVGRWIEIASRSMSLEQDQRLDLAALLMKLGRNTDALHQLAHVRPGPKTSPVAVRDLAQLYIDLGESERGLPLFEELRRQRSHPLVDEGWALVSASAGVVEPVTAWLQDRRASQAGETLLTDLFFLGENHGAPRLALASAQKLAERSGGRKERLYLARALIATGDPDGALHRLRSLMPGSGAEEEAYLEALGAAAVKGYLVRDEMKSFLLRKLARAGLQETDREEIVHALIGIGEYLPALAPAADLARRRGGFWFHVYLDAAKKAGRKSELVDFLKAELGRPDLSVESREERLYALFDLSALDAALPFVRRFAETQGGDWVPAYEDTLRRLNRRTELIASWEARARRPDIPENEKRDIAYRALEAGQKQLAESIFMELARTRGPDSPDVLDLLFLWGPRPGADACEWMAERAAAAGPAERARWMHHLINAGAAQRAVLLGRDSLPQPGADGPLLEAYLEALVAARDTAALEGLLRREIPATVRKTSLQSLARAALSANLVPGARSAYERILALGEHDAESLRQLGAFAFFESNYSGAKHHLSRYFAAGAGDCESHYYFGEILRRERKPVEAELHYLRALELLERRPGGDAFLRALQAKLLMRLGRRAESLAEIDALVRDNPQDEELRADLAGLLLDEGLAAEAQKLLSRSRAVAGLALKREIHDE